MAIVNNATLQALRTSLRAEFRTAFDTALAASLSRVVATVIPSASASNTYAWLSKFPQMREWVGDRVIKDMKEFAYEIQNKKFEATLGVDRADIEDDNLGQYRMIAASMGQEPLDFESREVSKLMKNGFASLCYDGQNFFDTDHPVYPNADGTGEAATVSNIAGSTTATGDEWFLLDLSRPLKPFIVQERSRAELDTITDTNNDTVFMKDQYLYGVRARGNFGYALWQQAVASKDTLNVTNFEAAYKQMQEFKRDGGDPMGMRATHLVVPPSLQSAAEGIVKVINLANGAGNPNYNKVELIVNQWL